MHITRGLRLAGDALMREAMLNCGDAEKKTREALSEKAQQCQQLAATAHHPARIAIASLMAVGSFALAVYAIPGLFPAVHVHLSRPILQSGLQYLYLASLLFGSVPLLIALRSIRCKRALFWPTRSGRRVPQASRQNERAVGELEAELFRVLDIRQPYDWAARKWVSLLIAITYCAVLYFTVFVMTFGVTQGLTQLREYGILIAILAVAFTVVYQLFTVSLHETGQRLGMLATYGEPAVRGH